MFLNKLNPSYLAVHLHWYHVLILQLGGAPHVLHPVSRARLAGVDPTLHLSKLINDLTGEEDGQNAEQVNSQVEFVVKNSDEEAMNVDQGKN